MFINNFDPVAFEILSLEIRWYSLSYIFGIIGAEYILRWLPIGTHDWDKFLTPQKLKNIVCNNNFIADETVGMKFNLLSNKWNISNDTSVNYISTFLKN